MIGLGVSCSILWPITCESKHKSNLTLGEFWRAFVCVLLAADVIGLGNCTRVVCSNQSSAKPERREPFDR